VTWLHLLTERSLHETQGGSLVDQLDIVMVLGPVVPDEQRPSSLDPPGHNQQRRAGLAI
jgi:hypothetical protein